MGSRKFKGYYKLKLNKNIEADNDFIIWRFHISSAIHICEGHVRMYSNTKNVRVFVSSALTHTKLKSRTFAANAKFHLYIILLNVFFDICYSQYFCASYNGLAYLV